MIRRATVSGRTVELTDEGPPEARAVVLLHGFTGNKDSWRRLRRALARRHRVLSIDLPGHGGTPAGADAEADSLWRTADLVLGAAESTGVQRFALVGYSLGGRVALALALAYPERVGRLLLESASAGLATGGEREARRRADEELARMLEREGIEAFVRHWQSLPLFATFERLPASVRAELHRRRMACSLVGLAASLRALGTGQQPWLGERLGELSLPVTLVVGAEDAKFRSIGAWMASRIADSRLEIVPGAGHAPHLERPELYRAIVERFLRSADSPTEEKHVDSLANGS